MSISFKGFNEQVLAFKTQGTVEEGMLVKMSDNATVTPCAGGNDFIGVAVYTHADIAAVQVGGYVSLPYSGTKPTLGKASICAASTNQIKTGGDKTVTVVEIDEVNSTAGILL